MADEPPPAKRRKCDFTETFDVLVGTEPNQRLFTVHLDILTQRSPWFKAARSERWTADPSKPADLTDHEPEVFADYLHYIHFERLHEPPAPVVLQGEALKKFMAKKDARVKARNEFAKPAAADQAEADQQFEAMVKLYLLADKLEDPKTANFAIDEFLRISEGFYAFPSAVAVNLTYGSTLPGNGLRTLMVDYYVHDACHFPAGDFALQFLRDLTTETMRVKARDKFNKASGIWWSNLLEWKVARGLAGGKYHQ